MKRTSIICLLTLLLFSCKENIDTSARYVFSEYTVVSYLKKYSDTYSQYLDVLYRVPVSKLSKTTVGQLLSARGNYTVFAPTNEAIDAYLQQLADSGLIERPEWDAFTDSTMLDSIRRVIVMNSVIDGGDLSTPYFTYDFPTTTGGEIGTPTMNDHKLSIYWYKDDSIAINKECPINGRNRDIPVINGIIHQMEKVIAPQDITATLYLKNIIKEQKEGFLVMARAIEACGLMDTLSKIRDELYEELYQAGKIPAFLDCNSAGMGNFLAYTPEHRKYGFTIFAETDRFWREQGLAPTDPDLLPRLQQWLKDNHMYTEGDKFQTDENYSSPQNLLYQWVTYHILPVRLAADRLVIHHSERGYDMSNPLRLGNPVFEYQVTLGKPRLLKLYESKASGGVRLNRFPIADNRRTGTNDEVSCDEDKQGLLVNRDPKEAVLSDIINACIYPINEPLAYTDVVRDNIHRERLRFDAMSLWPEATNSNIRKKPLTHHITNNDQFAYIPPRSVYPYFEDLYLNDQCIMRYTNGWGGGAPLYYGDEILCMGRYEIMFKVPPVPRRGTYELRYACLSQYTRGIAQIYFGSDPDRLPVAGIPFDFRSDTSAPNIGAEVDTDDQDYNIEKDKQLRNNGFLKGANALMSLGARPSSRDDRRCYRRIMVTQTMDPDKTYYLKLKTVLDTDRREMFLDYIELCPKEVYDNPENPEDIW